jgi:hypothetical protein
VAELALKDVVAGMRVKNLHREVFIFAILLPDETHSYIVASNEFLSRLGDCDASERFFFRVNIELFAIILR